MSLELCESDFTFFLKALQFAAYQHRSQRRKGASHDPYINHPLALVDILWNIGGVRDVTTLVVALLHDTIEDTGATPDQIRTRFGDEVLSVVLELTDNKSLPKDVRKELQVKNAPHKSPRARQVSLADKIHNIYETAHDAPPDWDFKRRKAYFDWTKRVVDRMRGQNPALEGYYDQILAEAQQMLADEEKKHVTN